MTKENKTWQEEFELDKEAHSQGRCSFRSLALCSAEEQRVKSFITDLLQKQKEEFRERIEKFPKFDFSKNGIDGEHYLKLSDILKTLE